MLFQIPYLCFFIYLGYLLFNRIISEFFPSPYNVPETITNHIILRLTFKSGDNFWIFNLTFQVFPSGMFAM